MRSCRWSHVKPGKCIADKSVTTWILKEQAYWNSCHIIYNFFSESPTLRVKNNIPIQLPNLSSALWCQWPTCCQYESPPNRHRFKISWPWSVWPWLFCETVTCIRENHAWRINTQTDREQHCLVLEFVCLLLGLKALSAQIGHITP